MIVLGVSLGFGLRAYDEYVSRKKAKAKEELKALIEEDKIEDINYEDD
jgi:hypothetical protein